MPNEITLTIGGNKFAGWTEVTVSRSMEALSGRFSFVMSDVWQDTSWEIYPQLECIIKIGTVKVITGFIDSIHPTISPRDHTIQVVGRDKTADLVDCSATDSKKEFTNLSLVRLVEELAKPFGISVVNDSGISAEKFDSFGVQPDETAFDAIERACRQRGVLAISNALGQVVLVTAGNLRADDRLVYGDNVKNASANISFTDRFSEYTVKGQKSGGGGPWSKADNTAVFAKAIDEEVARFRPMSFPAETQTTTAFAQRRVNWEMNVRAARSETASVAVRSWTQTSGNLWEINRIVDSIVPPLKIKGELLISGVEFSQNNSNGTVTKLSLKRKDAFIPAPVKKLKNKNKGGMGWPG